tara:strand:+ start:9920 stop:11044 length:1125 start_codon:yes stop_codon:yes gene_type:complete
MRSKLINNFIIGTFVSLYILVSVVSTIHVIDFFELSNPRWMAITLAIGFELGAAASLAALITLDKMNKTLVWALFIVITGMQIQGNMYFAFEHLVDFESWSELFNLIEEELLYQKRIISVVSGAILPLVALGFIKSLVDYIKPSGEIKEEDVNKTFVHSDWNGTDEHWDGSGEEDMDVDDEDEELEYDEDDYRFDDFDFELDLIDDEFGLLEDELDELDLELDELDLELDELDEDEVNYQDINTITDTAEEFDEDHALDMVMNDMVDDLDDDYDAVGKEPEISTQEIMESELAPKKTLDSAVEEYNNIVKTKLPIKDVDATYKFGKNLYNTMMSKINTDHLPKDSNFEPKIKSMEESTKANINLGLVNRDNKNR